MKTDHLAQLNDCGMNDELYHLAVERGMQYLASLCDRPVFPTSSSLELLGQLDEPMPTKSQNAHLVLDTLDRLGTPNTVAQMGGRYFGFVSGGSLPVATATKLLATFWDQNSSMAVGSPITAKLEEVVERWIVELLRLPQNVVAGFVSGSSAGNISALLAARYRLLKNKSWDVNEQGLAGAPHLRIIAGRHAHSTILKSVAISGIGKSSIEWVDVDAQGRIQVDKIPPMDDSTILILQAGNVNSGSFDDFSSICRQARDKGAWVHIDGAFGLWVRATEQLAHFTQGMEYAHSWSLDAHKTLNTPYDSGILLCADREALVGSLAMTGAYISTTGGRNGMSYTFEMSRRSRVIELWATLKCLGKEGVDGMVMYLHERAKQFAREISLVEGWEVLNDVAFNQVIVATQTDEMTTAALAHIQEQRTCWVGGSSWFDRKVIRFSVSSWATTPEDITASVASFRLALQSVQ